MTPTVAAVVVTYNSERYINALLDSLPEAFGPISWSAVVVDNGSTDETVALVEARGDCVVVRSENAGYSAGINLGVRYTGDADAFLILNPDATLSPGAVPAMIETLALPRVGVVAPFVTEADGRLSTSLRREPTLARALGLGFTGLAPFAEIIEDPREYVHQHVVDWAMGAVLLVSRACFDELGGFDESFFLYSEETDFCLRARDRGWSTMYTPASRAMHVGGGSGESATTHTMQVLNRVRLYRRRHRAPTSWVYFVLVLLRELSWAARGREYSWAAARALARPSLRPEALRLGRYLLPR